MGARQSLSPRPPRFHKSFRRCPVVLACPCSPAVQTVAREAVAALGAGADGVFLQTDGLSRHAVHHLAREIRSARPRAWIGLTCGSLTDELIESVSDDIQGLCVRRASSLPKAQLVDALDTLREWQEWEGLVFGGLDLANRDLRDHAAAAVSLSRLVDVVLLEMPALNSLFEVGRVKTVKHALGSFPVGVTADLSPDHVDPLACMVECLVPFPAKTGTDMNLLIRSVRACDHS